MSSPPQAALLALLPVALLVLQAVLNVPQLVRLFRAQHQGVALSGEALSTVAGAGWLVWAVLQGDPAIALSALLALVGFGPSTWVLVRAGRPWRIAAWLGGAVTVGCTVGFLVGGVSVLGSTLTAVAVVQYGAYLVEAVRCTDWAGWSPSSAALRVVFGFGWALHGAWQGTAVLVVWGLLTGVTFTLTSLLALRWRRAAVRAGTLHGAATRSSRGPEQARPDELPVEHAVLA